MSSARRCSFLNAFREAIIGDDKCEWGQVTECPFLADSTCITEISRGVLMTGHSDGLLRVWHHTGMEVWMLFAASCWLGLSEGEDRMCA